MSGATIFAMVSIVAIASLACGLTYLHMHSYKRWIKNNPPLSITTPARFYSYKTCKMARSITAEDDLEGQAQDMIRSIDSEYKH
jgi:uncharacterized protein YneF (UPF0154 family)